MPDTYTPETFTFSPARRERVGLAIALAGSSGSGKTKSALEIATGLAGDDGKIAVIDTEGRRALHYASQYRFDHLELQPPYTPERCTAAIAAAQKAGADVVIFDSASDEYEGEGGLQDIHDAEAIRMATYEGKVQEWKVEAMNAPAWKTPKLRHKANLIRRIRSFPGFVIFCLRAEEKVRFEKVKDERTGREKNAIVPAGWIPICEKRFMYDMTLSLTLAPETKGKPRFDLTHKITDDHIPFFPEGQFIGRRAGELLRLWATGAEIPPDMLPKATGQQPATKPATPGKAEQAAKALIDAANKATDETELLNAHAGETETKQLAWLKDKRPELYREVTDAVAAKRQALGSGKVAAAAPDAADAPATNPWFPEVVGQDVITAAIVALITDKATSIADLDAIEAANKERVAKFTQANRAKITNAMDDRREDLGGK